MATCSESVAQTKGRETEDDYGGGNGTTTTTKSGPAIKQRISTVMYTLAPSTVATLYNPKLPSKIPSALSPTLLCEQHSLVSDDDDRRSSSSGETATGHGMISSSGHFAFPIEIPKPRDDDEDEDDDDDKTRDRGDRLGLTEHTKKCATTSDKWIPYPSQSVPAIVVVIRRDARVSNKKLAPLKGQIIVVEGDIGMGKTATVKAMHTTLCQNGIMSCCCVEPTDQVALAEYMKYQEPLPETASPEAKLEFAEAAARAAINMQFSMMRRRCEQMAMVAEMARKGGTPVVDRGPCGDDCFMVLTFRKYHVSAAIEAMYIAEFQRRYMKIKFPNPMLIVMVRAPVEVAYKRYLARESKNGVRGNRYSLEYFEKLQKLHDACSLAWNRHVIYDNGDVAYIEPSSAEETGHPEQYAINSLLLALCDCAKYLALETQ